MIVHRRADVVRHIEQKFALARFAVSDDSAFKLGVFLLARFDIPFERFLLLEKALFRASAHKQSSVRTTAQARNATIILTGVFV